MRAGGPGGVGLGRSVCGLFGSSLGSRGLATRARSYALRHVTSSGTLETATASPRDLVDTFSILPRDCRLLQTTVSHIQVRADYFIFRFPPFSGAVRHDRVLLIENDSAPAAEALQARLMARTDEEAEDAAAPSPFSLPFEHRVLEAVLREDTLQKWDRYMRLKQLINATTAPMGPHFQGAQQSWTSWLGASWLLNAEREVAVYRLLTLSKLLAELSLDVKSSNAALNTLLGSDEDMAATYLTFLACEGTSRTADQHTEVELMLENFATEHEDLLDRINTLSDSIDTHRLLEQLRLSNERNRIMRLELLLSFGTASLAACAAVAGFFGMNLKSGVEDIEGGLWLVTGGASTVALGIFAGLVFSVRRFHSSQQRQIARTASLERSLSRLDAAYFALRTQGILLADAPPPKPAPAPSLSPSAAAFASDTSSASDAEDPAVVTREGLRRALDAVNEKMAAEDVDALFKLLDADGSGVLTRDELGLRGEAAEAVARYHSPESPDTWRRAK